MINHYILSALRELSEEMRSEETTILLGTDFLRFPDRLDVVIATLEGQLDPDAWFPVQYVTRYPEPLLHRIANRDWPEWAEELYEQLFGPKAHPEHHHHRSPLRWTFSSNDVTFTGEHLVMSNFNPGKKIGFKIDGKDAGKPLDLSKATVTSDNTAVATVSGAPSADGTSYSGTIIFVGVGAAQINADDVLADGRDVKAAVGVSVVEPATMEIVLDPAGQS